MIKIYLYSMPVILPEIPFPVYWIDSDELLLDCCKRLSSIKVLALDTEFDRFRRKYGINLEIIQLFDGEAVYLIRVLSLSNILPLKSIMENREQLKLLYSGSEDIQVFKVNDVNPKGVFDLQAAAQLSGFTATSLSGLLQEILEIGFDKSKQKSDWSKNPLDREQLIYAANDVIYLPALYHAILIGAKQNDTLAFIEEENKLLEAVEVSESKPRLKQYQREMFNRHEQAILLALIEVRDGLGKAVNKPPHFVLADKHLDDLVQSRLDYAGKSQLQTYSAFFKRNETLTHQADIGIRKALQLSWPLPKTVSSREEAPRSVKFVLVAEKTEAFILQYQAHLLKKYPASITAYLCSGIKRFFREYLAEQEHVSFLDYRQQLLFAYIEKENIDLKKALI